MISYDARLAPPSCRALAAILPLSPRGLGTARVLDSCTGTFAEKWPSIILLPRIMQAELLTAFGGGPMHERKAASISAVAEDAGTAGLASKRLSNGGGPIHPVAEHLPSSSLTSTPEMYRPSTIGGSVLQRQQSLGASVLSWPAVSAPLPPLSSVRCTPADVSNTTMVPAVVARQRGLARIHNL